MNSRNLTPPLWFATCSGDAAAAAGRCAAAAARGDVGRADGGTGGADTVMSTAWSRGIPRPVRSSVVA